MKTKLALLGAVELVLLTGLGWGPAVHRFPLPGLLVFGLAFVTYAIAAWELASAERSGPTPDGAGRVIPLIWLLAIAMRVALLPLTPELSDDVYRYLWDGHVQLSGTNPYLFAPGAPEVESLRTNLHGLVNNPDVPTIYPPLAQLAFLVVALLGSSIVVTKLLWIVCDLATAAVLAGIARDTGRDERLVLLLYLWAPLMVVEVAWSAHLEPLGLLMMALAIRWAHRASASTADTADTADPADTAGPADTDAPRGPSALLGPHALAGVTLALSALTKFAPAAALPPLLRRHGWRALAGFALTVAVLYAPYVSAGEALFTGLRTYGEHWWLMKGPFSVLELVAGDPLAARRLAGIVVLGVVVWTVVARFDLERALLWVLGAGMIVTPTLHPWYVLWMLPMAALRRARAWILLGGLAFIGYFGLSGYRVTGEWLQPVSVRAALWLPFLAVLALDARRAVREGVLRKRDGALPESR